MRRASPLALPLLLAGCFGGSDGGGAPADPASLRWEPDEWRQGLLQPAFDAVQSTIHYLAAQDGTQLSLSLHLPVGLPSDRLVPTLLQITPYQPLNTGTGMPDGSVTNPFPDWAEFVLRGAAYVEADARGTGGSEGCLDFGGALDRADAQTFYDWILDQPWSNGVVVTDGISHPGMGSVVAHAAVPGISGALAHAPVVSYYQDEWLQGAKFDGQGNSVYQAIELAPNLWFQPENLAAQAAPCTGRTALDFAAVDGPFTDLWADRHLARHIDPVVKAPVLLTHGFVDLNVHPDHTQLYWDALPDDYPKHMVLGWWYHGWPDLRGHFANATGPDRGSFWDLRQRWLDATLHRLDNGLWEEPRVLVEDSQGTWHESDAWPLAPSERVTLWPDASGALAQAPGTEATATYEDRVGTRRGYWTDASVTFRTEPLAGDRLVNGAPEVRLVASSNVDATKWVAYLLDEAPDGSWERVSHGYADSHTWGPEQEWRPMDPGTPYTWTIKLLPTAVVVPAGHRLTLLIASQDPGDDNQRDPPPKCFSDYRGGCYNPTGILPAATVGRAEHTVHLGPQGTHVTLAWVDPAATAKPPWPDHGAE